MCNFHISVNMFVFNSVSMLKSMSTNREKNITKHTTLKNESKIFNGIEKGLIFLYHLNSCTNARIINFSRLVNNSMHIDIFLNITECPVTSKHGQLYVRNIYVYIYPCMFLVIDLSMWHVRIKKR